jgi:hypothetical protein
MNVAVPNFTPGIILLVQPKMSSDEGFEQLWT